jgi:poly-beta-hydroxyalkanoate depolymerase
MSIPKLLFLIKLIKVKLNIYVKNMKYCHLLGKDKDLGEGISNFYSEDLWIYELKSSFIKQTILFIEFDGIYVINIQIGNI